LWAAFLKEPEIRFDAKENSVFKGFNY